MVGPRGEREREQQAAREDRLDDNEPPEVERGRLEREADDDGGQPGKPERPADQAEQDSGVEGRAGRELGRHPLLDHVGDREGGGGRRGQGDRDRLHAGAAHAAAKLNAMSDIMTFGWA